MLLTFFVLGLIIGSFLNVVIYRIEMAEDLVLGKSKCPKCGKPIRWFNNIPLLSFVLLRGRCRDCREKISWQYPLVEFATGVLFCLVGWKFFVFNDFSSWLITLYWLFIISSLIVVFVYDLLYLEIPVFVIFIGIVIAMAFNLYSDWGSGTISLGIWSTKTYTGILGAILVSVLFFALSYGSGEKWMGKGDAYLSIFLGLVLGFPLIFYALILGFFIGALWGVSLIALGKKKMKSQIPLGPFLVTGTLLMILFSDKIIEWYWHLIV